MLFGIQFLNDFASVNSKERQFGEELYSSEVKHQPADGRWYTGCPKKSQKYWNNVLLEFQS
jgi:hypothetical protein